MTGSVQDHVFNPALDQIVVNKDYATIRDETGATLQSVADALAPLLDAGDIAATDPTGNGGTTTQAVLDNLQTEIAGITTDDDISAVAIAATATGIEVSVTESGTAVTGEISFGDLATALTGNAAFMQSLALALIDPTSAPINELAIGPASLLYVNS